MKKIKWWNIFAIITFALVLFNLFILSQNRYQKTEYENIIIKDNIFVLCIPIDECFRIPDSEIDKIQNNDLFIKPKYTFKQLVDELQPQPDIMTGSLTISKPKEEQK